MGMRHPIALIILVCTTLLSSHPALAQFSQQEQKLVGTGTARNVAATLLQSGLRFESYDGSSFTPMTDVGVQTYQNGSSTDTGLTHVAAGGYPYIMADESRNLFLLHPGTFTSAQVMASLGYPITTTGRFVVTGAFARANDAYAAGDGVRVFVLKNSTQLFAADISSQVAVSVSDPLASTGIAAFNLTLDASAGDVVRFVVSSGVQLVDGTFDATAVRFSVAASQPDLLPQSVLLSSNLLTTGGSLTVTANVKNQGAGNAAATTTMIRLNGNAGSSSPSDSIQQGVSTPSIAAGNSANVSATFTLHSAGIYYAHVYVDSNAVLSQSNVGNDTYHSGPIAVSAGQVLRRHAIAPPMTVPAIQSLSPSIASPGAVLQIHGSGFDPTADIGISFFDAQGFAVVIPALSVTTDTVTSGVPPVLNLATGAFVGEDVNVRLVQTVGLVTRNSNVVAFKITDPPPLALPAGSVTANLAGFAEFRLLDTIAQLQQAEDQTGGQLSTTDLHAQLSSIAANLDALKLLLRQVTADPNHPPTLGYVGGKPILLDTGILQTSDQLLIATLRSSLTAQQIAAIRVPTVLATDSQCGLTWIEVLDALVSAPQGDAHANASYELLISRCADTLRDVYARQLGTLAMLFGMGAIMVPPSAPTALPLALGFSIADVATVGMAARLDCVNKSLAPKDPLLFQRCEAAKEHFMKAAACVLFGQAIMGIQKPFGEIGELLSEGLVDLNTLCETSVPKYTNQVRTYMSANTTPVIDSFTAEPPTINVGKSSTLAWVTANATSASIDNGVGPQQTNSSVSVSPAATSTYTLTATGPAGTANKKVTVTVTTAPPLQDGVTPSGINLGMAGGCPGGTLTGTFRVTAASNVSWTAAGDTNLLDGVTVKVSGAGSGSGTVTVSITVAPQKPSSSFSNCNLTYMLDTFDNVFVTFSDGLNIGVTAYWVWIGVT